MPKISILPRNYPTGEDAEGSRRLRRAESVGRPLGDAEFLAHIETMTGRNLKPSKPGPRKAHG